MGNRRGGRDYVHECGETMEYEGRDGEKGTRGQRKITARRMHVWIYWRKRGNVLGLARVERVDAGPIGSCASKGLPIRRFDIANCVASL